MLKKFGRKSYLGKEFSTSLLYFAYLIISLQYEHKMMKTVDFFNLFLMSSLACTYSTWTADTSTERVMMTGELFMISSSDQSLSELTRVSLLLSNHYLLAGAESQRNGL